MPNLDFEGNVQDYMDWFSIIGDTASELPEAAVADVT